MNILGQGPRPNIHPWASHPHNSPLKFPSFAPRKKGGFPYYNNYSTLSSRHLCPCRCLFNCPKAHSQCFGIRDALVFIFCDSMFLTFYGTMEIQQLNILLELERELSRLLFSLIYILLKSFDYFTFCTFKSQELVRGALLPFRKSSLVFSFSLLFFNFVQSPFFLGPSNFTSSLYYLRFFFHMSRFAYLVDTPKGIESFKAQY